MFRVGPSRRPRRRRALSGHHRGPECDRARPWNPGIRSQLPAALLPLATIFRAENVLTGLEQAHERSAFTGLDPEDLVAFRPERLAVHELLIRVTADLSVPGRPGVRGPRGQFPHHRRDHPDRPHPPAHGGHRARLSRAAATRGRARRPRAVAEPLRLGDGARAAGRGRLRRLLGPAGCPGGRRPKASRSRERRVLAHGAAAAASEEPLLGQLLRNPGRLAGAIRIRHGRLRGDRVRDRPGRRTGLQRARQRADRPGDRAPHRGGRRAEGYRLLPSQERPVVMNVKGASASGKSTMRPLQRKLAKELGILGRLCRDQPRHLAQVSARLRQSLGDGEQIRRHR